MRLLVLLAVSALSVASPRALCQSVPSRVPAPAVRKPAPWEGEIEAFEAADRVHPPPKGAVLFVGSSSIRLWPALKTDFRGVSVIQRGFGGTDLYLVNYYITRIVIPYRPRLIVLYAGDNDLAIGRSPQEVFQEFKKFVSLVRRELPETRIAFISIKPSIDRWPLADKMRMTNELVRKYAATVPRVLYVDVFTPMLGPDGLPRKELFSEDKLHMNAKGYALWRDLLRPVVRDTAGLM